MTSPDLPAARPHPPLWVFAILVTAGAVVPFVFVAMPFLLRREGVPVDTIAGISASAMLPFALMFAWAPLADMLLSRRNWVLAGNAVAAGLLLTAILLPRPKYLALFAALLIAGNVVYTFAYVALLGLMAELLPDSVRGKAGGWFQAGNAGSIPLFGGAALWLIERRPLTEAAVGIALMSFLPALPVLLIAEPRRSLAPNRDVFVQVFRELKVLLKNSQIRLGFLYFLSPIGACAAYSLFSAIGTDYHASPAAVLWVTAMPGGVLAMAAGALLAGAINDFFPRRTTYLCFGTLVALAGAGMALAPVRPATFCVGGLAYEFVAGMTAASFTALSLELSGGEATMAGTRMALFASASFIPLSYMTWIDGEGDRAWGVRGLFGTEACLGLATALLLFTLVRRFWPAAAAPARSAVGANA